MTTTELMFEYLSSEGFRPEKSDFGISFRYEGKNFLFFENESDNEFFQLALPGIFEMDADNQLAVYRAMDATNGGLKVVKCCLFGDTNVWVFFEILIDSTPELGDIVPRALGMLKAGQQKFYDELQK